MPFAATSRGLYFFMTKMMSPMYAVFSKQKALTGNMSNMQNHMFSIVEFGDSFQLQKSLFPDYSYYLMGYKDLICSNKQNQGQAFFSKDAHDMSAQLLNTAQLGFLSDLVGVSLYYRMGIDKDGLTIYRTIHGTNSIERGGFI